MSYFRRLKYWVPIEYKFNICGKEIFMPSCVIVWKFPWRISLTFSRRTIFMCENDTQNITKRIDKHTVLQDYTIIHPRNVWCLYTATVLSILQMVIELTSTKHSLHWSGLFLVFLLFLNERPDVNRHYRKVSLKQGHNQVFRPDEIQFSFCFCKALWTFLPMSMLFACRVVRLLQLLIFLFFLFLLVW